MPLCRLRAEWEIGARLLRVVEPSPADVRLRAADLAAAYNDVHNRAMMANTITFDRADVVSHYAAMAGEGARQFFLHDHETFVGDADFRNFDRGEGEFAILIAARQEQGKGFGTRFARLLHALAFRALGLERVYVTILPQNVASQRLFRRLGYELDATPAARARVDHELDLSMSITRDAFARTDPDAMRDVRIAHMEGTNTET
jgi:RimJ/RimL family protein N-acetyltransferase